MEAKPKISASQFFIAMFVSRAAVTIGLNAPAMGGEHLLDNIFSVLGSLALGFVLVLPLWALHKRRPELNVAEAAAQSGGWLGKLVSLLYIVYFFLVGVSSLALFQIFLQDTVNPDFSAALIIAAVLGVALYGTLRGVETAARCAVCVLVVLLLGCFLVFGAVAGRFQRENMEPLFYDGYAQTLQGGLLFLSRTAIFADMAVLLPMVRGKKKLGFTLWSIGVGAFVCLLIFLVVGCLGRYAYTQNFPVYALAAVTEIPSLQRLDAVFIGVWMMGLTVKLSFDLYACRRCFSLFGKQREPKAPTVVLAVLMFLGALLAAQNQGVRHMLMNVPVLLWGTLITGFFLPLLVLALKAWK